MISIGIHRKFISGIQLGQMLRQLQKPVNDGICVCSVQASFSNKKLTGGSNCTTSTSMIQTEEFNANTIFAPTLWYWFLCDHSTYCDNCTNKVYKLSTKQDRGYINGSLNANIRTMVLLLSMFMAMLGPSISSCRYDSFIDVRLF